MNVMSEQLVLERRQTEMCTCLNFKRPKGAGWTEREAEGPVAAYISHVHVKHLHQSVGRYCRGPSGRHQTLSNSSRPIKRVDTKIPEITGENIFSPPREPLLGCIT